jgi:hypothetical protein
VERRSNGLCSEQRKRLKLAFSESFLWFLSLDEQRKEHKKEISPDIHKYRLIMLIMNF